MSSQPTLPTDIQVDLIFHYLKNNYNTQPINQLPPDPSIVIWHNRLKFHSTLLNYNLTLVSQQKLKSLTFQLDDLFSSSS